MKFSFVLAVVAAATVVSAESNAARLARGLSPNPPVKRGTQTARARRSTPSGSPGECSTGSLYCCSTVGNSDDEYFSDLLEYHNLVAEPGTPCGSGCSPISGIGVGGGADCSQEPVCCDNNNFNGLINIGCSPININL